MTDLEAVGAVAAGLKPALDLANSLANLVGSGKGRDEVVKLIGQLVAAREQSLAAQAAQAALTQRVRDLEKELVQLKEWDGEKARYELKDVGGGVLAYAIKPDAEVAEPPHSLCPRCYQHRVKSILQREVHNPGRRVHLACPECRADLIVSGSR